MKKWQYKRLFDRSIKLAIATIFSYSLVNSTLVTKFTDINEFGSVAFAEKSKEEKSSDKSQKTEKAEKDADKAAKDVADKAAKDAADKAVKDAADKAAKDAADKAVKDVKKTTNKKTNAIVKDLKKQNKKIEKFTGKFDEKIDKAFKKYAKQIAKAQKKYQKTAEKIANSKNPDLKMLQAEDKLSNRLEKADQKFVDNIFKVSKQLENNESLSLTDSGWINKKVFSKDFTNHGQRVKTYVEIAKFKGLPAYVGALQANFGNPYETGIAKFQNKITDLNSQITLLNTQLLNTELTVDKTTAIQNQINILTSDVIETNGLLKTTIKNIKPGVSVGSGWETANLDINNDGIVNEADLGD